MPHGSDRRLSVSKRHQIQSTPLLFELHAYIADSLRMSNVPNQSFFICICYLFHAALLHCSEAVRSSKKLLSEVDKWIESCKVS